MDLHTGPNTAVDGHLKECASKMKFKDKLCVLMFDEMSIRQGLYFNKKTGRVEGVEDLGHLGRSEKPATHSLVFMLKGLNQKWKQPYCFYFTGNIKAVKLAALIEHVVKSVQDLGLIPVATVCDQCPTNVSALKILSNRVSDRPGPYFEVGGMDIVYFFDAPHLLKSIRNNLLDKDVILSAENNVEYTAKWDHIRQLYQVDREDNEPYWLLPKLTEAHVNPEGKNKMKVKRNNSFQMFKIKLK